MSYRSLLLASCRGMILLPLIMSGFSFAQTPKPSQTQESKSPNRIVETQIQMRAKLASSQKIMEGLVTENFALVDSGAKQLKKIAQASHWPTTIDETYQHYSVAFRLQCDKLAEQADRKDLQAAHYTYLHMSTTCIDCHNYVRGRFRVERKDPDGPFQLIPTQWDEPGKKKYSPPQPDDWKNDKETPQR